MNRPSQGIPLAQPWDVWLHRQPEKVLRRLPSELRHRLDRAILALGDDPRPQGSRKLSDQELYRVRVGDWRIVYAIQEGEHIVLVLDVSPRGGAYKQR